MAEILKKDKDELDSLINQSKRDKNPDLLLNIAIKAKEYADLVFESEKKISAEFKHYKKISAENYVLYGKETDFHMAYLMAIIIFLQMDEMKKANKYFKKILRKKKKHVVDEEVLDFIAAILGGETEGALQLYLEGEYSIDDAISPDIDRLLKYIKLQGK